MARLFVTARSVARSVDCAGDLPWGTQMAGPGGGAGGMEDRTFVDSFELPDWPVLRRVSGGDGGESNYTGNTRLRSARSSWPSA